MKSIFHTWMSIVLALGLFFSAAVQAMTYEDFEAQFEAMSKDEVLAAAEELVLENPESAPDVAALLASRDDITPAEILLFLLPAIDKKDAEISQNVILNVLLEIETDGDLVAEAAATAARLLDSEQIIEISPALADALGRSGNVDALEQTTRNIASVIPSSANLIRNLMAIVLQSFVDSGILTDEDVVKIGKAAVRPILSVSTTSKLVLTASPN